MEGDGSVDRYFLSGAATHVVVGAFDDRVCLRIGEAHGAVFGIVSYSPDTRGGLYECLVTGGIVSFGDTTAVCVGLADFHAGGIMTIDCFGVNGWHCCVVCIL